MKKQLLFAITLLTSTFKQGISQDWATTIAPIFYQHCTSCHHPGGIAPFSLITYNDAYSMRFNIKYAVQTKKMPPWPPDTAYSRFVGERTLSASEVQAIVNWVNNGAPAGNLSQAPPPPVYSSQYQLPGQADLTIQIPVYTSSATTDDEYVCFSIPSGLTTDRYIKAFEVVPGNPSIVHHAIVGGDTANQMPPGTYLNCFNPTSMNVGIGGYAPGSAPSIFPSQGNTKFGIRLKANANIIVQMHYPKGSIGKVDSTKIRFFFYPTSTTNIRPIYVYPLLQNWNLNIPANTVQTYTNECPPSSDPYYGDCKAPFPISVYAAFPHSHLLCKTIENYATNGTDTVKLIRINNWDFHWQGFYTYKKLQVVPANYKWIGIHTYDNTTNNPNNPNNPPQNVTAGEATTDEMLFDAFMFLFYQPGDENINIDSLITVSVKEFYAAHTTVNIFPNPAKNTIYIQINSSSTSSSRYQCLMYNLFGQIVEKKEVNHSFSTLDVSNVSSGLYFIQIVDKEGYIVHQQKVIIQN